MPQEIDRRNFGESKATPERQQALQDTASSLQGLVGGPDITIAKVDPITGNPAVVKLANVGAALDTPDNFVQRALSLVKNLKTVLGLAPGQEAEFAPPNTEQQVSSGAAVVHLQQEYKGIPIFQAAQAVRFDPSGTPTEIAGSSITVAQELDVAPQLSASDAVLKAAQHVAVPDEEEAQAQDPFGQSLAPPTIDLSSFNPQVVQTFPEFPQKPTLLEDPNGPFPKRIKASLIWFPMPEPLRLAWEVILTMPAFQGQFRIIVDAENGEILYSRQLLHSIAARGNVYLTNGDGQRQMKKFPLDWSEYPLPLPPDLQGTTPPDWVDDAGKSTAGNTTIAHLGDVGQPVRGTEQPRAGLTFNPNDALGDDQKVVNIFFHNCFMHDFFYLLGFREKDGNFQRSNSAGAGLAGDPVDARAHAGEVWGTANFVTPNDGTSPTMNMGLVTNTNRHTAFDASVVYHEYSHGVTKRLVGGPMNGRSLDEPQSGGMGEGWGDYFACMITNQPVVAGWVVGRPGGIRAFPYDANFPANDNHFGSLGKGRYTQSGVHAIGEIWCATLMQMTRNLGDKLGMPRGAQLGLQLVVDALKLSPANPSFLDMRDAIIAALDNMGSAGATNPLSATDHAAALSSIWAAFAKFGMGPAARSLGATVVRCDPDFTAPPAGQQPQAQPVTTGAIKKEATPNVAIPDKNEAGVISPITVNESGKARSIKVSVNIVHPYISDLQVGLVSPSGKWVLLHDRAGADQDNLVTTYDSASTPALAALLDQPIQGNWVLGVRDLIEKDAGKLNAWSLEFSVAGSAAGLGEAAGLEDGNRHRYGFRS